MMDQSQEQKRRLNRGSTFSTPSPSSQPRSPASGYSKLILSAIKDLPYETQQPIATTTTTLKLNVSGKVESPTAAVSLERGEERNERETPAGQTSRDGNEQKKQQQISNSTTPSTNKRAERRSLSCEHAVLTTSAPIPIQQRTQSVFVINNNAAGAVPRITTTTVVQQQQQLGLPDQCSLAVSSRLGSSCLSIHSTASTAAGGAEMPRSPSVASSICSKDDKTSVSNAPPKIPISICAKALYICATGQLQELKALIKENPDLITYQYPYCYRQSCLHIAAKTGDLTAMHFLIKNGAHLDAKDDTWSTPMHLAAKAGHLEVVRQLRAIGADPAIRDAYGRLASDYVTLIPQKQQQTIMTKKGATLRPTSKTRREPQAEEDAISLASTDRSLSSLSLNSSSSHRHHNYSFQSFRKPISRAVRDLFHRK